MQNLLRTITFLPAVKFWRRLLPLLVLLLTPTILSAQPGGQPARYTFISVDLWPDYDRPELLVILNGGLAPETPLPATVTLPLPSDASLNAVARMSTHNVLIDDLDYTIEGGNLIFTTPDLSFRVEYYQPYEAAGQQHEINFRWTAPLPVQQFIMTVQEPFAASDFTLSRDIMQMQRNSDNLRYHILPSQTLTAGEEVALTVSYTLPDGSLSRPAAQPAAAEPAAAETAVPTNANNWWLYALGSVLLLFSLVMIGWGIRDQMQANRVAKPKRRRGAFCSSCGQPVGKVDKFCGNCGTALG